MRDLLSWNVSLGRWAGVQVRLHFFFLVFALLAINPRFEPAFGAVALGVLFLSVLLHELGHCLAAAQVGGRAEQVMLWPFGGLTQAAVPHDPRAELIAAGAGPFVNLLICVAFVPVVAMWPVIVGDKPSVWALLNPLAPPVPAAGVTWPATAALVFWMNWMLVVINLLPATPLDGGRMLRSILWPMVGYRRAAMQVSWAARLCGIGLCLAGWLVSEQYAYAWVPMSLLGVFLFFSAQQDADRIREGEREESAFGYDFSQGYTSLDRAFEPTRRSGPGPLRQWLDRRREVKLERRRQIEAEEDRRVDEVLERLHQHGPESLSPEDRALLDRVSARYRNRETH